MYPLLSTAAYNQGWMWDDGGEDIWSSVVMVVWPSKEPPQFLGDAYGAQLNSAHLHCWLHGYLEQVTIGCRSHLLLP